MANIKTNITLCSVPITPTHQIDFKSKSSQYDYFREKGVANFPNCSYQARSSTIRIKGYVDKYNECNYGFYTNTYRGTTKTFYFWILQREYVAKEVCELIIQIDVIQTWLFDMEFSPCVIERCHVTNDKIGSNTFPEDFELGDYVSHNRKPITTLQGEPCFFLGITDASYTMGGIFGRTYSGFGVIYYDYKDVDKMSNFIKDLANEGKADAIAFIFSFPKKLMQLNYSSGDFISGSEGVQQALETFNWGTEQGNSFEWQGDTYQPYNNKLYTYPFNFITVRNSSGSNIVLKLENFTNPNDIMFRIEGVLTQSPTITMTPLNYCNKKVSIEDSISMNDFGLCSWNNDNYSNWFAQHQNTINAQSTNATAGYNATGAVSRNNYNNALDNNTTGMYKGFINTGVGVVNSLASGNIFGAVTSGAGGVANTMLDYGQGKRNASNDLSNTNLMNTTNYQNQMRSILASVQDAQVQPNTCKGDTRASGLDMARDTATFWIEQTSIKPEYARIIDSYFQMYGYQVNRLMEVKFRTRQKWNFIKTINSNCVGNIPRDDIEEINYLLNNGLTFWHDEKYMYKYNEENTII